jgi:predicted acetyltransferase
MSNVVELIHAGAEHRSVLENLLQLYIHDFSELVPVDVGDDGRYSYDKLPPYWSDASRLGFLARFDGKLVGFALVVKITEHPGDGDSYDMAEFFVLRKYRRRGVGWELAEKVWLRFPGRWQIRVMAENVGGVRFCETSITKFTGRAAQSATREVDGKAWHVFSLDSRR